MATAHLPIQGAVVWEWCNEYIRWRPYEPHVSNHIEAVSQKNPNSAFSLGGIDPSMAAYQIDIGTKEQVRLSTGTTRTIRRSVYPLCSLAGQGIVWQWMGDGHGHWHNYDSEVGEILEHALNSGHQQLDLLTTPALLPYIVDLKGMTQTRQGTGFVRKVRRVPTSVAYTKTAEASTVTGLPSIANNNNVATSSGPMMGGGTAFNFGMNFPSMFGGTGMSGFTTPSVTFGAPSLPPHPLPAPNLPGPSSGAAFTSSSVYMGAHGNSMPAMMRKSISLPVSTGAAANKPYMGSTSNTNSSLSGSVSNAGISKGMGASLKRSSSGQSSRSKKKGRKKSPDPPEEIESPATDVIGLYINQVQSPNDEDCAICCEKMNEPSGYAMGEGIASTATGLDGSAVYELKKCKHVFHKLCITAMYNSGTKDGSVQCPTCKTIHGVKHGNCPPGRMDYNTLDHRLPGYLDCNTICISYNIPSGVQVAGHPAPGQPYSTRGFPRICYIPNNEEGQKVLKLLIKAWKRRLTFTIGTSVTTGEVNCVVWNEIHHKTELGSNRSGHGYPDPNYLDNVTTELALQGVTETDDESDAL